MTPDDAFLQAILESPDDDAPRLIYADWLEERDDPRGEFIRVQCELAQMATDDPRRPRLENHEKTLLQVHEKRWIEPLDEVLQTFGVGRFRRGFVGGVSLPPFRFLS